MTELPGLLRTLWFTLRIAFGSHPALAVGTLLLVPAGWLSGTLGAWWLKVFVNGATDGDATAVAVAAALLVGTQILGWAAAGLGGRMLQTFQDRAGVALEQRLIEVSAGMAGIEHLERPDYLDRLDPLRREAWIVHWTLEALAQAVGALAQTALTISLLAAVHPALALLPLFGVPALLTARSAALRARRAQERLGEDRRLLRHLVQLASKPAPGKEIRVFGIADQLRQVGLAAWRRMHRVETRTGWMEAGWSAVAAVPLAVGFTGALLLVGYGVITGRSTVGDLALTVVLAQAMSRNLSNCVEMLNWLTANLAFGARFLWLHDMAEAQPRPTTSAPAVLETGIELREVSFRYPGTDRPVLDHVSLTLPAGSIVAVVGDNGAGKTTLTKLLCGMYRPQRGAILLDGVDLTAVDLAQWRSRCTAAFQDHARLELTLRDAVAVGDLERGEDSAVLAALHAAGAEELSACGLETQLGPAWPGGTDLSGGQWQKVALARAFMRPAPLLTILDEPTAALDALAEDALFTRHAAAARARRADGGITLLVSHRFSTVRAADLIVVLAGGRLVEQGSHQDLLDRGGRYAELYNLQARGYR